MFDGVIDKNRVTHLQRFDTLALDQHTFHNNSTHNDLHNRGLGCKVLEEADSNACRDKIITLLGTEVGLLLETQTVSAVDFVEQSGNCTRLHYFGVI